MLENISEKLKRKFEANMLDGDKIDDCGNAMISAKDCLDFFLEEFPQSIKQAFEESNKELDMILHFSSLNPNPSIKNLKKIILEELEKSQSEWLGEK